MNVYSRHAGISTLTDARSSLTAENASKTIIAKEWVKCKLGENADYLAGVSTTTMNKIAIDMIKIGIRYEYDTVLSK